MSARSLLALGQFDRRAKELLAVVATESGHQLQVFEEPTAAYEYLDVHHPHVIIVDTQVETAEAFCLGVRARSAHVLTPIIALVDRISDLAFADAFNWGGDDVVAVGNDWSLLARLRRLPSEVSLPQSTRRGVAVVADPDRDRRIVRARVLRNAGYQIQFAVTADDLKLAREATPQLIVADEELQGVVEELSAIDSKCSVNTLLLAAPRHLGSLAQKLAGNAHAVAADGFAPPENIVFLANEMGRGGAGDKRASKRLLYGTRVVFRGEGREDDDCGYSYNISDGGLYVRSLAPPDDDRVWLELRPPRSDRLVRLEGQVVWRRPFGPLGFATVPPGFGVRIVDATQSNRVAWKSGYDAFAHALAT